MTDKDQTALPDDVEIAAKAIYNVGIGREESWDKAHSRTKMTFRSMAKAALSTRAAADVKEG